MYPNRRNLMKFGLGASASLALAACSGVKTSGGASGGAYPSGPIGMSIGFAPGGSTDLIGRTFGRQMESLLSQPMPVVNTPGANGVVAAKELSRAKADGYSVGIINASTFTITPLAVTEKEKVAPKDFDVLLGVTQDDWVLVTTPKKGWTSIDDVKKSGKKITFGTTGSGSGAHLCGALTFALADIPARDVPFEGDAPSMTAVLGGQVDITSMQLAGAYENIQAGKLVPLATFSSESNPALPNVQTVMQQGYDFYVSQWRTFCAPEGLPDDVRKTLVDAARKAAESDDFAKFCEDNLLQPKVFESEEIVSMLEKSAAKNKELVEKYDIKFGV